tara:strand:- start:665 stop:949 length:285 start_codon:yes stop_codon:yes gene_type:complete
MIRFVEVNETHIREGMPENSESCAVALALAQEYKSNDVSVDTKKLMVNGVSLKVSTDQICFLHNWILEYDESQWHDDESYTPKPFTLKIIEQVG